MVGRIVRAARRGLEIVAALVGLGAIWVTQNVLLTVAGTVLFLVLLAPLIAPMAVVALTGYGAFDGKSFVGGGLYGLALLAIGRVFRTGGDEEERPLSSLARAGGLFLLLNAALWVYFKVNWDAFFAAIREAGE